jgi:hypothetical protein
MKRQKRRGKEEQEEDKSIRKENSYIHQAVNATSYNMADYCAGTVICFGNLH